jgi:hypothetical protein
VQSFYLAAYNAIRASTYVQFRCCCTLHCDPSVCITNATWKECKVDDLLPSHVVFARRGIGSGPYIAIHEGFQGVRAAGLLFFFPSLWHCLTLVFFMCYSLRSGKGAFLEQLCYYCNANEIMAVGSGSWLAQIDLLWINTR